MTKEKMNDIEKIISELEKVDFEKAITYIKQLIKYIEEFS